MTTRFFLVRHAAHDQLGRVLTGRSPGVGLNAAGRRQAESLAAHLSVQRISAVQTSPLDRARQTAEPIARRLGLPLQVSEALNEIDFGLWSGRSFEDLSPDPLWRRWNTERATTRAPGGETMEEARTRFVSAIDALAARHRDTGVVLVSHCDMIKAVLARPLGLSLDRIHDFEIQPASVSVLDMREGRLRTVAIDGVFPE